MNQLCQLCFRVQRRARGSETVRHKIPRQCVECFSIAQPARSNVRDQNRLVILRSSCQNGSYERDPNASSLIPGEIGKTRSFIVLILWQERICQLAHGHEQRSDSKSLESPEESHVFIVRS